MTRRISVVCKIIAGILSFCLAFLIVQKIVTPRFEDAITLVEGFFAQDEDSIEVLFLGASQMFCGVNAEKLTNEYGIDSYDYGASSQSPAITYYYLQEALKHQKPKVIMVECCQVFSSSFDVDDSVLTWNYALMPLTAEKWNSLNEVLQGNKRQVIEYCLFPLFVYHSRWGTMSISDPITTFFPEKDYSTRGYQDRPASEEVEIAYLQPYAGEKQSIPKENRDYLLAINEMCEENNIQVVFFKAPSANWTRADSAALKEFMEENQLTYFELNDYLQEIGIDGQTDFYDEAHMNRSGAEKTTDFLAKYLVDMIGT